VRASYPILGNLARYSLLDWTAVQKNGCPTITPESCCGPFPPSPLIIFIVFFSFLQRENMHNSAMHHDLKDEMPDEKLVEAADMQFGTIPVSRSDTAMTRRILVKLDFR